MNVNNIGSKYKFKPVRIQTGKSFANLAIKPRYSNCHVNVPVGYKKVPIFFPKDRSIYVLPCAHRIDDEVRSDGSQTKPEKHHQSGRALP
jgi:hypothetical protein